MKIYRIRDTAFSADEDQIHDVYAGTKDEAKANGVVRATPPYQSDIEVTELEVQTDKAGVLAILQGNRIFTTLRTWRMTARGGLKLQVVA